MSNVFQLGKRKSIEDCSGPKSVITIAVANILTSNAHLIRTVKELSKHLEAVDHIIDAVSDTATRDRFRQIAELNRETLANAMLELCQEASKLRALQGELAGLIARSSEAAN